MRCDYCRTRKGKRSCPGLRGRICPSCCGRYRLQKIACPEDCFYLQEGEAYAGRKIEHELLEKFQAIFEATPPAKKEGMTEAMAHLLAVLQVVMEADPRVSLEELLPFLKDLRSGFQRIVVPSVVSLPASLVRMRDPALKKLQEASSPKAQILLPEALDGLMVLLEDLKQARPGESLLPGLKAFVKGRLGEEWIREHDWRSAPSRPGSLLLP